MNNKKNNTGVFFEANPNPMWIYEPESLKIKSVNDAAIALYGYSRREMLSLTLRDLRPESEVSKLQEEVNKRKQEFSDAGIWLHKKKNDKPLYVRILSYPITWEDKKCKLIVAQDITKQKDIEQHYLMEHELLDVLVQHLPGTFFIFDREGKMLRWNRQVNNITGYSDKETEKMSPLEFFAEEDHPRVRDAIEKAFSEGYKEIQTNLITKKGKKIPFYFQTSKINILEKPHLIGVGIDISSLKEAEFKSEKNRLLLDAILHQAGSAISVKDREGRYRLVNRKHCELFDLDPDEIIGKKTSDIYAKELSEILEKHDKKVFREGKIIEVEETFKTVGGERTFLIVKYPLKDVPGHENSVCSIATDITERKTAEKELQELYKKEKRERLRIEHINSRLKLLEMVGNIFARERSDHIAALQKVARLLVEEVADTCSFDIFEGDSLKRIVQEMDITPEQMEIAKQIRKKYPDTLYDTDVLKKVVKSGKPVLVSKFTKKELRELVQNQEQYELAKKLKIRSYFILPLKAKEKVLGVVTLVILQKDREFAEDDLSFLSEMASKTALHVENSLINEELQDFNKRLENRVKERTRQLENTNEELESFSYSVSHDLRTPLRAIGGYTSLLLEDYLDQLDKDGKEFLTIVNSEVKRMGKLIDDLLAFSRLSRQEKVRMDFSMKSLVRQCIDELIQANPDKNPMLEVKDLPDVDGDPKLLRQVWANLIGNAVKYQKDGQKPHIIIGSDQDDQKNHTVFYVKDNGVGFNMKYADKLFGVFQRLHSDDEFEGTGIGLALVRRIVNRHGGDVWAESEVDKGSTFYFSLPNNKTALNN